jgi:putative flippase GtrA
VLKPIVTLAAVGFVGAIITKLLFLLLIPIFGTLIGFVALAFKIALIVAMVWLGFFVFRKLTERPSEA